MKQKQCRLCLGNLQTTEFYKSKCNIDGLLSYCKKCHASKSKSYYSKNKTKIKINSKNRYLLNKDYILEKSRERYDHERKRQYDIIYKKKFYVVVRNLYLWIGYRIKKDKNYKDKKILFSFDEFKNKANRSIRLKKVYEYWRKNGYKVGDSPSVDRINNNGDYSLNNIQFLQMRENARKRFRTDYKLL